MSTCCIVWMYLILNQGTCLSVNVGIIRPIISKVSEARTENVEGGVKVLGIVILTYNEPRWLTVMSHNTHMTLLTNLGSFRTHQP